MASPKNNTPPTAVLALDSPAFDMTTGGVGIIAAAVFVGLLPVLMITAEPFGGHDCDDGDRDSFMIVTTTTASTADTIVYPCVQDNVGGDVREVVQLSGAAAHIRLGPRDFQIETFAF